ncbi:MAG: sulfatase-like hydrolase/transferase [Alphaproteobacteria bacterium]|nr:sulfatase-like hydrolase/transferase [Alphaproteobacteria bacterium]
MSAAQIVKRALLGTVGFGATVATVHLAIGMALMLVLNVPPMTGFAAMSVPMEIALALPVGLLLAPVLLAPKGQWIHPALMAVAWIALERWVAVDPTKLQMWIAPTVVATLLFYGILALVGRFPKAIGPVLGGYVVLPLILLSLPEISYRSSDHGMVANPNRGTPPAGAPDVVFIVMDTTRAKSVHALGYERDTTPTLDALSKEGVLFTNANSPATWSLPAHSSLFTGKYPSVHQGNSETRFLGPKEHMPTIAQTMSTEGWETLAFSANPYISDTYGLTRGFDYTDKAWKSGEGGRQFSFIYRFVDKLGFAAEDKGGATVVGNIHEWMASRPKDAPPAFVFVNFLEAHFPFNQLPHDYLYAYTDRPFSELADASQTAFGVQFGRQLTEEEKASIEGPIRDMYDGGVKYTDHLVGQVIEEWRKRGTLDNTIVVVLGDHGEMIAEHGAFGHVSSMYQPDLHVPLVIRYPKKVDAGTRREDPISTVSVFMTILDMLDLENTADVDIAPSLFDNSQRAPIIAERFEEKNLSARFEHGTANGRGPLLWPTGRYRSFREGKYKLVWWTGGDGPWLFDLDADPNEDHDLAAALPDVVAQMTTTLEAMRGGLDMPPLDAEIGADVPKAKIGKAECEQLKALGYIAPDAPCDEG